MSLEFLSPRSVEPPAVARSPMERQAREAGARFEVRDGWNLAVAYPSDGARTGWADLSHLPKFELAGSAVAGALGRARRDGQGWWCPLTPDRLLVLGQADALDAAPADALDVTTVFAALALIGPEAGEIIARFCALDLRDPVTPVGAFRPGSIARQPGLILREGEQRYLMLFGWAIAEYMWTVVEDAARHVGAQPIGLDALDA